MSDVCKYLMIQIPWYIFWKNAEFKCDEQRQASNPVHKANARKFLFTWNEHSCRFFVNSVILLAHSYR